MGAQQDQDLNLCLIEFILQHNSSQGKPRSRPSWQQGGSGCGHRVLPLDASQAGHSLDSGQSPRRWGQEGRKGLISCGGCIEAIELPLTALARVA